MGKSFHKLLQLVDTTGVKPSAHSECWHPEVSGIRRLKAGHDALTGSEIKTEQRHSLPNSVGAYISWPGVHICVQGYIRHRQYLGFLWQVCMNTYSLPGMIVGAEGYRHESLIGGDGSTPSHYNKGDRTCPTCEC